MPFGTATGGATPFCGAKPSGSRENMGRTLLTFDTAAVLGVVPVLAAGITVAMLVPARAEFPLPLLLPSLLPLLSLALPFPLLFPTLPLPLLFPELPLPLLFPTFPFPLPLPAPA